ncbi:MAG: fibronectin [Actinobacteria bacterium]|nr:fibronectin [Actinomycetota bacterium]MSX45346.1 fibronectin [Actinomycetota bacterium]MSX72902.1 fibronectin [Actinomycetota bacterium]MSZ00839.1 fibronectin [Actinomycetota bacterium]MTA59854.1 fibronectin [Actinomycetota bacterium]
MRKILPMKVRASAIALALVASIFSAPTAQALYKTIPATQWGNIYAGTTSTTKPETRGKVANAVAKSKFEVKYNNFPDWAKREVQAAVDVWAANFSSSVPVIVDASWGRSSSWGILGSARPSNFYSGFAGAPDPSLWYASALANSLAGKDLDKANPEMVIQVNSGADWNTRGDGAPSANEYDLESVFLHEIAHGLGFLSNDAYDSLFGIASLDQPTSFDAYAQTADGRRLADLPSPSLELGKALTTSLVWSGPLGIKANNGVKPKLYTPSQYEPGSSTSHLDEATFSKTGLDSVMTPNLDPGEIFKEPGPLLLAMMEDMHNKPPAGVAIDLPEIPRNVQAFVADSAALISFDPPVNIRTAQITEYVIKNLRTGLEKKTLSSPIVVSGLKNGTSYTFSVVAKNTLGFSEAVTSKAVIPQAGWKSSILDSTADGKSVSSTSFNGQPAVVYTDTKSGDLKLAIFDGKSWKKVTVDGAGGTGGRTSNPISGPVSLCVNGSGTKQTLHIFYSDSTEKDLRYAAYNAKRFTFEIVDGNGPSVNDYADPIRVRTSSDVSVTNACVATASGIQVFYRDESQGVLLGAVKTKSTSWSYEMIDGDRKSDSRTTGDVGFHLQAIYDGAKTYIAYDSVVSKNQKNEITAGAIRVAVRAGSDPNTWSYQTLDISTDEASVFGYDVAMSKINGDILITWLATSIATFPKPNQIRWAVLSKPLEISKITTENFGTPGEYLSTDGKNILFNCQDRLCVLDTSKKDLGQTAIRLIRSTQGSEPTQSTWVTVNKVKYVLATVSGKLALLKP